MPRTLPALRQLSVTELKGVGPTKAAALKEVDVENILDLLTYYPRRYIDRTNQRTIKDLVVGEVAYVLATVRRVSTRRTKNGKSLVEVELTDGSGGSLRCSFFNQPWRAKQLHEDAEVIVQGKVDVFGGRKRMSSPIVDFTGDETGRIVPVYAQSEKAGIFTRDVARWVEEALERAKTFAEPLPESVRDGLDLQDRTWAFHQIHRPESFIARDAARRRLAFDELLRLQMRLVLRKRTVERESKGFKHVIGGPLARKFRDGLPYELTGAQRRAIAEIEADLAKPHPMHRLLQGDVGSGKTLVAVSALLVAVEGGLQGAFMAPTEVLAEQHYLGVRAFLAGVTIPDSSTLMGRPVRVELLTNRTTASERTKLHAGLESGDVDVVIGTHALLTERVAFKALGVIVIDEQHRFGVEQRAALRDKGDGVSVPDVLVMTATPIPLTAAMTVYGDLDVTTLDELPPGRTPIRTVWARGPLEDAEAWERVREEISKGHQAYVVCPLVEESERIQARSATEEYERLREHELAGLEVGLLHGQMSGKDKEATMSAFRAGQLNAVVATTVIEVGVDVPNATVMVILDADRFGLAQLHQLRGRVGRGKAASWCYLLSAADSDEAQARLQAFSTIDDGFELAEKDLELRGEGTVLGARQKGRSDLKLASLRNDRDLVEQARRVAFDLVDADPELRDYALLKSEVDDLVEQDEAEFQFKS